MESLRSRPQKKLGKIQIFISSPSNRSINWAITCHGLSWFLTQKSPKKTGQWPLAPPTEAFVELCRTLPCLFFGGTAAGVFQSYNCHIQKPKTKKDCRTKRTFKAAQIQNEHIAAESQVTQDVSCGLQLTTSTHIPVIKSLLRYSHFSLQISDTMQPNHAAKPCIHVPSATI